MWNSKILVSSILVSFLLCGCPVTDLYHALDRFEYLITLADLADSAIQTDVEVNWEALSRLQDKYGVDVAGPAAAFLVAAQDLERALQQLDQAIETQYRQDADLQILRKTLRRLP